jgi:hypothetical protein
MGHAYCTLFDREFLFRGLALYESLEKNAGDFTLWILCMDDTAYDTLAKLPLPHAELIRLVDFEDDALRAAKQTRNALEYCWTCTASVALWVLRRRPELESVTYIDADLMFFSDPEPLFDELGAGSTSIIEHRFAPRWEHMVPQVGVYNVEYLTFRNDERGLAALGWWRDRCIEWCYDRLEDGKIADQMYLDDWPERFPGVVVLQHPGAGLAPWNVERYEVDDGPDGITVDGRPLIFYHYSSFAIVDDGACRFVPAADDYRITSEIERIVYAPYISAIERAIGRVQAVEPGYTHGLHRATDHEGAQRFPSALKTAAAHFIDALPLLRRLRQKIRGG